MADHETTLRVLQVLATGHAYSLTDLISRTRADEQYVRGAVQALVQDGRVIVEEIAERHQYRAARLPTDRPLFAPSFDANGSLEAIAGWVRIFGVPDGLHYQCAEHILSIIKRYQVLNH